MSHHGYDVVVDVDAEADLGHTDLREDNLEFHPSTFHANPRQAKFLSNGAQQNTAGASGSGAAADRAGSGTSSKRFLWTLAFYAQFFDVDTDEVLRRCRTSLYPRAAFLDVLDGNPDLYGPFWIATTVIFILFLTGTMSQYLAEAHHIHFEYNFTLLSGAAGLVYGYTSLVPLGLWAALAWFGGGAGAGATIVELWALYGYANLVWIVVALVSWSPITILNYVFVAVGLAWSLAFLLRNLWPVVGVADQKISRLLLILVIVLHAGLAVAIKILFFAHGSPAIKKGADVSAPMPVTSTTAAPGPGPTETPGAAVIRAVMGL